MCLDNSLSNIRNRLNGFMNGRLRLPMYKYLNIPKVFLSLLQSAVSILILPLLYNYKSTHYYYIIGPRFSRTKCTLKPPITYLVLGQKKNPTSEILKDFNIESQTIFRLVQQEIGVKSKFRIL